MIDDLYQMKIVVIYNVLFLAMKKGHLLKVLTNLTCLENHPYRSYHLLTSLAMEGVVVFLSVVVTIGGVAYISVPVIL